MFHADIISNFDELGAYRAEWNQLLSRSNANIFLTWEWVSTWWEFFGTNSVLFVVAVRDAGGKLVGLAPLKISSRKTLGLFPVRLLEFIGYGSPVSPEYLDFIVAEQDYEEIVTEIVEALMRNKESWDVLYLSDVDANSPVLPLLKKLLSGGNVFVWQRNFNVCPYLRLPSSLDELLNSYSYKKRSAVKRTRKKLESSSAVKLVLAEDPASLPHAFEQAARLHRLSRQKKGETGNFCRKNYLAFHLKLSQVIAGNGWLYLAFLEVDQRPVAFRYGYLYGSKYYDYQTGYDPQFEKNRVGAAMLGYVVEDLIAKSVREFDFLRGEHEYKWHWTKEFRRTVLFCGFQRGLAGLPLLVWWPVKERIKRLFLPHKSEVSHEKN
ncbi:MAG: GNAT family N-acetyltransferase [Candidatus Eisenbacteria bacterium]|nr:GNAT family N-acetyltransferase [Candidatus Eisenbacteria bacterium]